ncbi:glyoxylase I family protein [Chitinophaga dinghuensis]|uniref:Glyoxylase I family protein n=1 Tax=Chitinophaga dinghuensis TaxID=1539050 RepID=A0A327W8N6_9BACT|nr:VOC family protein [Chitinophaga dinghuensis]RAJ85743.1 glyoxylase I family protein [Chitinophaga dinghuensis]
MILNGIHHIAIICSDYERSKAFYRDVLGLRVIREVYREERDSWKLDLAIGDQYVIELFSFPNPPARVSRPEAQGLRHLAFAVTDIDEAVQDLQSKGITPEPVRIDPHTNQRFTFFADPDGLPLELYEVSR